MAKTLNAEPQSKVINGRMYIIGENNIATPVPLGPDDARNWKSNPDSKPPRYCIRNGQEYEILEDPKKYAGQLIENDSKIVVAKKSGGVIVQKAEPGTKFDVYTANGNLEAPEVLNEGNVLVTRANDDGTVFVDEHGHTNTWQVSESKLQQRYDIDKIDENGFVRPKSEPQTFIQVDKPVAVMKAWGENGALIPQTIDKGGYLNITSSDDVYGIAEAELASTYKEMPGADKNGNLGIDNKIIVVDFGKDQSLFNASAEPDFKGMSKEEIVDVTIDFLNQSDDEHYVPGTDKNGNLTIEQIKPVESTYAVYKEMTPTEFDVANNKRENEIIASANAPKDTKANNYTPKDVTPNASDFKDPNIRAIMSRYGSENEGASNYKNFDYNGLKIDM